MTRIYNGFGGSRRRRRLNREKGVCFVKLHRHERQYSLSSVLPGYTIMNQKHRVVIDLKYLMLLDSFSKYYNKVVFISNIVFTVQQLNV